MTTSIKKFIASTATATLVATAVVPAANAEAVHSFKDVSANYDEAVSFLYSNEIIKGKTLTTFGTNMSLTRGDAAVILAGALGLDTENVKDAGFTDLNSRIRGSVNALAEYGIIAKAEKFNPNNLLSRGAMAKLLVNGFGLEDYEAETPFTDAVGAFGPYIEALYGTEITSGKTTTTFGTNLNITRGEFAKLLYNTIVFVEENSIPYAKSLKFINSKTFEITFEEAVKEQFIADDVAEVTALGVKLDDQTVIFPQPTEYELSADRTKMTVHYDLSGKAGVLTVDDIEQAFDFKAPIAGVGKITLDGVESPISFDFAGTTAATVTLTTTSSTVNLTTTPGTVNLNGMEMSVADTFAENAYVTVILKDTDVEAAAAGKGKMWGRLEYKEGKWVLVDSTNYDIIPEGNYQLEAIFTDINENSTTLTLNIKVE
jgi:hypothetical protein